MINVISQMGVSEVAGKVGNIVNMVNTKTRSQQIFCDEEHKLLKSTLRVSIARLLFKFTM